MAALLGVSGYAGLPVLLAACADRRIAVWDLDGKETTVKNLTAVPGRLACPHDAGWVRCLNVSPDGKWLATGGSDRRLKLWAFAGGKPADKPTHDTEAHAGWVEGLAFSPDGKFLVTGGADLAVKVWNAADLTPVPPPLAVRNDQAAVGDGSKTPRAIRL